VPCVIAVLAETNYMGGRRVNWGQNGGEWEWEWMWEWIGIGGAPWGGWADYQLCLLGSEDHWRVGGLGLHQARDTHVK
jgi:hypothetical protein